MNTYMLNPYSFKTKFVSNVQHCPENTGHVKFFDNPGEYKQV